MKLNLPKKSKVLLLDCYRFARFIRKHYKYEFDNTSGEDATVLQKYVVGSDR